MILKPNTCGALLQIQNKTCETASERDRGSERFLGNAIELKASSIKTLIGGLKRSMWKVSHKSHEYYRDRQCKQEVWVQNACLQLNPVAASIGVKLFNIDVLLLV